MSFLKVVVVFFLMAAASGRPDSSPSYGYTPPLPPAKPEYSFDWAVKDDYAALDFGQHETRDGYNTEGSYYVLLPDSRVQKVTYTVHGDDGYVATVEYEGEAKHDAYGKAPAPVYTQPPAYEPPPTPAYGYA
ncbi:cuticle protein 7-like [Portunus trituberculatus]|uniref:cuticle protein 7-like n=1 Tax=Portunus trituberculatus TaxID=210409 RepID=UPI001E1D1544|nr:cuticle protein 7-like [Portunus trituberculatus]